MNTCLCISIADCWAGQLVIDSSAYAEMNLILKSLVLLGLAITCW